LLRHGLLRASFIPAQSQRHLRDLTRYRTHLIEERSRLTNRLQAMLEDANIKVAAVVTDIRGVSARAILEALIAGETDTTRLADLARGRLRSKRDALNAAVVGRVLPHHAFLLTEQLSHLDYLDEAMAHVTREIEQRLQEEQEAIDLLDTVPGISQKAAQVLLAELGSDLTRFPDAKHLASWVGICPGNAESGGKRLSGKTRKGNIWLRQVLIEIAHVASKTTDTYLAAQYRRIAARRGKKRALIALAHTILVIIYQILTKRETYHELGGAYFDERERQLVERRLVHRLQRLGYAVTLQPPPSAQPSIA